MSTEDTTGAFHEANARPPIEGVQIPAFGAIERMERLCLEETPPELFYGEMLRAFVAASGAVFGLLWRAGAGAEGLRPFAQASPGVSEATAQSWTSPLRELALAAVAGGGVLSRFMGEASGAVRGSQGFVALAFPMRNLSEGADCVTVVVRREGDGIPEGRLAFLRLLAEFTPLYAAARSSARFGASYRLLSSAWSLIGESAAFTAPHDIAQTAVNRARTYFGAERVALGFVRGGKVTVAAISGEDIIDPRSNLVRQVQAAQMEVVLAEEPGLYSAAAPAEERAAQLSRWPHHERLAAAGGAKAVYSVPLKRDKDLIGVWTFEFGEGRFSEAARQVIDVTAGQLGPLLSLALLNERPLMQRARDAANRAVQWVFKKEQPWRRAALVAGALLLAFAAFGRKQMNVSAACRLAPSFRRIYSAPFDSTIKEAPVRPGDTVSAGQALVTLDREQVELQLREARSRHAAVEKEMMGFLAQQQVSRYEEAKAMAEALDAQIRLQERNLERTTIRSDMSGLLLQGDLTREIGRPVRMGQELVEVAPLDTLILEIALDQGDVIYVRKGQEGRFTTRAQPGRSIRFTVDKVRPMPEVRDGAAVYVAEARIPNADGTLRPGMEGVARISAGRRNVTWVACRKLINWLRLQFWW